MTAASTAAAPATSLARLLETRASARDIEQFLDGLSVAARLEEVLGVTGGGVKRLYDAVADAPAASLEELIPAGAQEIHIYEGRNSLAAFSRFQKRFARMPDGKVVGYNHQSMSFVTGPGYFVVKPPSGDGAHPKELLFDYTEAPPSEPAGWPSYKPNTSGLSRLVYADMHDYCRRVARGVIVGKAYRRGVDQKAYFSLTFPR